MDKGLVQWAGAVVTRGRVAVHPKSSERRLARHSESELSDKDSGFAAGVRAYGVAVPLVGPVVGAPRSSRWRRRAELSEPARPAASPLGAAGPCRCRYIPAPTAVLGRGSELKRTGGGRHPWSNRACQEALFRAPAAGLVTTVPIRHRQTPPGDQTRLSRSIDMTSSFPWRPRCPAASRRK